MILDRLYVDQVRLFEATTLQFAPQFNLITGENGAGKTTLLEAAHLLVRGRSFRRGGLDSLIKYSSDRLLVQGRFGDEHSSTRIELTKQRGELVSMQQDRERVTKISSVATKIPIQTLTPNLAELVLGAPELRRRWLDQGLVHSHADALDALGRYRHVLRQRNAALRHRNSADLDVWDGELAETADRLTILRRSYVDEVEPHLKQAISMLCPDTPIRSELLPGFSGSEYADYLGRQRQRDIKLGITAGGPHRADVQISVDIAGVNPRGLPSAASQLSRGQARSLAAAFTLGQVMYLRSKDQASILLVDDLGSEMDRYHTDQLLQLIEDTGSQTLATAVNASILPQSWIEKMVNIHLSNGQVA